MFVCEVNVWPFVHCAFPLRQTCCFRMVQDQYASDVGVGTSLAASDPNILCAVFMCSVYLHVHCHERRWNSWMMLLCNSNICCDWTDDWPFTQWVLHSAGLSDSEVCSLGTLVFFHKGSISHLEEFAGVSPLIGYLAYFFPKSALLVLCYQLQPDSMAQ